MSVCHALAFRKPHSFHLALLSTVSSLPVSIILSIRPEIEDSLHHYTWCCKVSPNLRPPLVVGLPSVHSISMLHTLIDSLGLRNMQGSMLGAWTTKIGKRNEAKTVWLRSKKKLISELDTAEFKCLLCHVLAVWPWVNHLAGFFHVLKLC